MALWPAEDIQHVWFAESHRQVGHFWGTLLDFCLQLSLLRSWPELSLLCYIWSYEHFLNLNTIQRFFLNSWKKLLYIHKTIFLRPLPFLCHCFQMSLYQSKGIFCVIAPQKNLDGSTLRSLKYKNTDHCYHLFRDVFFKCIASEVFWWQFIFVKSFNIFPFIYYKIKLYLC